MKKLAAFLICISLFLTGCGGSSQTTNSENLNACVQEKMALKFSYGDREGAYCGEVDESGLPDGFGTFASQRPDGAKWTYCGEWEHGHWNCRGITSWDEGATYLGRYENDLINGIGMFVSEDGTVTVGNYVNETATGWCAIYLAGDYDGYVFWGNFEDGKAVGTLYLPDGTTYSATYSGDSLVVKPYAPPQETVAETIAVTQPPTTEPETEPTKKPTEAVASEDAKPQQAEGERDYILNTNSKKFHYPDCSSAGQIKDANKQTYTGTRSSLIAKGYTPCGKCNP